MPVREEAAQPDCPLQGQAAADLVGTGVQLAGKVLANAYPALARQLIDRAGMAPWDIFLIDDSAEVLIRKA